MGGFSGFLICHIVETGWLKSKFFWSCKSYFLSLETLKFCLVTITSTPQSVSIALKSPSLSISTVHKSQESRHHLVKSHLCSPSNASPCMNTCLHICMSLPLSTEFLKVLVTQLCLTFCDSMDCSLPGSSVHGILQARILRSEYWSGLLFPSPGDLPDPGIEPESPALQAGSLPSEPPRKWGHQWTRR